jgi:anti-sigma factor (TIGR02949 family)
MISCTEAVRQLWEYLEDDVGAQDRAAVEEHLAFCRRCCGELEFAEELRRILVSATEVELPTEVEDRLLDALADLGTTDTVERTDDT